ncbi:MAG: CRISPR-associated endoribonuclease Cas6 [Blastocatellia bacterium]
MRIRITLTPLTYPASMPVNHHPLAAFIYQAVAVAAPNLAGWLHDEGLYSEATRMTDRRLKFFVFALPELPPYRFQDEAKCFDAGSVHWQIGSPLPEFIEALVAGLAAQEVVRIGRTQFAVTGIEIVTPPVFTDCMRFVALSPLSVSRTEQGADGRRIKHYLRADESDFGRLVAANLRGKYQTLYGAPPADPTLHFEFDEAYIRRVGGYASRRITRLIQYKETKIKACLAPFIVSGNPDLIRLGWESGFGSASSQGFGMAGTGE